MSHIVKIKFKVEDLDCLEKAAESLGMEMVRNQDTFKSYNVWACEHLLRVKGNPHAYEVGIISNKEGSYDLIHDPFMGGHGTVQIIGEEAYNLKQRYTIETGRKQYEGMGFRVWEEVNPKTMRPRLMGTRDE